MEEKAAAVVERIIEEMETAFAHKDVEALLALFTEDATLESFLVARIFNRPEGVCRGRAEIRELLAKLVERGVPWGGHSAPLVRGNMAAVEFKMPGSDRDTFSVDILELEGGKIRSLRAYAGWRAMPGGAPKGDRSPGSR
jgi:hypothetical protein